MCEMGPLAGRPSEGLSDSESDEDRAKSFSSDKSGRASGRWTRAEHEEFLRCLAIYGREWKKVSQRITTRTAAQIRSHAQKYFKKVNQDKDHEHKDIAAPRPHRDQRRRPSFDRALEMVDETLASLQSKRRRLTQQRDLDTLGDRELIALEMLSRRVCT